VGVSVGSCSINVRELCTTWLSSASMISAVMLRWLSQWLRSIHKESLLGPVAQFWVVLREFLWLELVEEGLCQSSLY